MPHKEIQYYRYLALLLIFGVSILSILGSGGGDDSSGDDTTSYKQGYFDISGFDSILDEITDPNTNETIYITSSNPIGIAGFVKGLAEYYWGTCAQVNPGGMPLSVTWKNLTTGASGSGTIWWQDWWGGLSWHCLPAFRVSADLAYGTNHVVLTANHVDGHYTDTSLTFKKIFSPPENVSVVSGNEQLTIKWDDVVNATSTNLYWSTSYYLDPVNKIENVTSPYILAGLDNNITYHLYLTSVDPQGLESGRSTIMRTTPGWPTMTLENTVEFDYDNEVAIATDSNNKVHIVGSFTQANTNNTNNKYYTNRSGSWAGELLFIDTGNPDASLAVDSNNLPHFSHAGDQLIHYYRDIHGAWENELIEDIASCSSSLAIDGSDSLYVLSHADDTLKYATNRTGDWQSSAIGNVPIVCPEYGYSAIAKDDSSTNEHIAFRNGDWLYYQFGHNGSPVLLDQEYPRYLSMATDSYGYPHIIVGHPYGVEHHYRNYFGWYRESIPDYSASFAKTSVAIDQENNIHIAFPCGRNYLCYSTNRSGAWKTFHLDYIHLGRNINYFMTAISVDGLGFVHIVYFKQTETGVKINYVHSLTN